MSKESLRNLLLKRLTALPYHFRNHLMHLEKTKPKHTGSGLKDPTKTMDGRDRQRKVGGGSNASNLRAWKVELQRFADKTGLKIVVSHYPPGTSKWNKIEHRMFSFISRTWEGKPLVSIETIIDLIESTTTKTGLT